MFSAVLSTPTSESHSIPSSSYVMLCGGVTPTLQVVSKLDVVAFCISHGARATIWRRTKTAKLHIQFQNWFRFSMPWIGQQQQQQKGPVEIMMIAECHLVGAFEFSRLFHSHK